jgi:hypothetical protein
VSDQLLLHLSGEAEGGEHAAAEVGRKLVAALFCGAGGLGSGRAGGGAC